MTLHELSAHLEAECYQSMIYHIGPGWERCGDTYCLEQVGRQFEIFYVERGQRGNPLRCFDSESDACAAFIAQLQKERFSRGHCIGFFGDRNLADSLAEKLASAGIAIHRDTIPYGGPSDLRYRVFVFGRDKLRADEFLRQAGEPG